ncbi:hypothetical protein VP01_11197g1 [Puccinia sorghi]|uniref:Uncharacterized protein n=1 Tax=Puccinia sorghi TaxID=27349 RepID=A0A0L6VSF8_9BASI|nr:hypothetical protein VP01_11197g1 [Puccinia sorghi]
MLEFSGEYFTCLGAINGVHIPASVPANQASPIKQRGAVQSDIFKPTKCDKEDIWGVEQLLQDGGNLVIQAEAEML